MYKAFGIVNSSSRNIRVEGLEDYRPIGAFSFLGRYRMVDFPISNLSNSGIDRIQIYVKEKPRTLVSHIGTGRHYNINSKSGRLQILFTDSDQRNNIYNTDIASYYENMECIEEMHHPYVVITPDYMVYTADFSKLIEQHIQSEADITLLYHAVDNAKDAYLNCNILNLNKQKGVLSIEPNHGNAKNRNIFMDTYIMKKDLFIELIRKAKAISSAFTLADIINELHDELDVIVLIVEFCDQKTHQNAAEHAGIHSLDAQHHGLACAVQAGKRIRLRQQAQLGQRYIARCQVDKITHQGDERRLMLFPLCQRRRKTGAEQHAQI